MRRIKHVSITSCSNQGVMVQNIVVCTEDDELYELTGHAKNMERTWQKLPALPEAESKAKKKS